MGNKTTFTAKTLDMALFQIIGRAVAQKIYKAGESGQMDREESIRRFSAIRKAHNSVVNGAVKFTAYVDDGYVENFAVQSLTHSIEGVLYTPNNTVCQCAAYVNGGYYCWHRGLLTILDAYAPIQEQHSKLTKLYEDLGIISILQHDYVNDEALAAARALASKVLGKASNLSPDHPLYSLLRG